MKKYDPLEIARILGEPKDPRRPYSDLLVAVAQTDTAEPNEYVYYFDVLQDTDKVLVITSTGEVTSENVTPDSPALLTFADLASPEYYVKLTDLASAKERVLARKVATINRALNAYENYQALQLIDAAVDSTRSFSLRSGVDHFDYQDLVTMIDSIIDYADGYVLVAGTTIDKDIKLWDWTDNKYTSLASALKDLNVTIIRQFGQVTIDGSATDILSATVAYLVGTNTEVGAPLLWVRKRLNELEMLGGTITQEGADKPERLIFVSPNPVTASGGTTRYLAVGLTGYQQYAAAVVNPNAVSKFSRA